MLIGTPSYIAPEQITAGLKLAGPATDVYSMVSFWQIIYPIPFRRNFWTWVLLN